MNASILHLVLPQWKLFSESHKSTPIKEILILLSFLHTCTLMILSKPYCLFCWKEHWLHSSLIRNTHLTIAKVLKAKVPSCKKMLWTPTNDHYKRHKPTREDTEGFQYILNRAPDSSGREVRKNTSNVIVSIPMKEWNSLLIQC